MSGKTILITRGVSDGEELREELQALGNRVIHEPLTEIFLNHTIRQELNSVIMGDPDAIIVTSRYGVRALAALDISRDSTVICVGAATAAIASSLGYSRVYMAGRTVDELVNYIADAYDNGSRFLYASAAHVRADIEEMLENYGMYVKRLVVYEAIASEALSDTLIEQLKRGQVDAVTFLSQRSAEIFMRLLAKADAEDTIVAIDAYCLSETIAEALRSKKWKGIYVSKEPTLASLVACVDNGA